MKLIKIQTVTVLLSMVTVFTADGKISGYMFGDYYYIATNHNTEIKGNNGFWFRRIYFTYDQDIDKEFTLRFRVEMNSPGDFTSSSKLIPYVKDAFIQWKHNRHSIIFGISVTPTWNFIEKTWGYRSIEKTALDLQKYGSSRDFGIALKGSPDKQKRVNYHLMIANGSSNKSETDKGKKILFSLSGKPAKNFIIEGYVDFEERPGHTNRTTYQLFTAYRRSDFRWGLQFAYQNRQVAHGTDDLKQRIGSCFTAMKLSEKIWGFARLDRLFDPNPDGARISYIQFDTSTRSTLIIAGMDFKPIETVHIMPNFEAVFYDKTSGKQPDTDIIPRITVYYVWK